MAFTCPFILFHFCEKSSCKCNVIHHLFLKFFNTFKLAFFPDHCPKFNRYHFLIHIFPKIQKMCLHPDRIISLYRRFAPYICDTVIPFMSTANFTKVRGQRRQKFFLRWDQIDRRNPDRPSDLIPVFYHSGHKIAVA